MNLQDEYMKEFPKRKALNNKGKATKDYETWLETKQSPFLQKLYAEEQKATAQFTKEYKENLSAYEKAVKQNKKKHMNVSMKEIEQKSHPKHVEAFLHPKVK